MSTPYSIIQIILTVLLYLVPLNVLLPFKLSKKQNVCLGLIIFANLCLAAFWIGNISVIPLLVTSSLYLAFVENHHLRNICLWIIAYLLNVIFSNLLSVLVWQLFKIDIYTIQTNVFINYVFILFTIGFMYFICKLIVFMFHRFTRSIRFDQFPKRVLATISLNLLLTLALFIMNIVAGEQIGYPPTVVYFNTFVFVAYFLISSWTILRSIQIYQIETDQKAREASFQAIQKYTDQIEALYNNLRSFKHDYQNILMTLYGYIAKDDMAGLSAYFQEEIMPLTKQLEPQNYHIARLANIRIVQLKSLLTAKIIYAQEMGIDVVIEVASPIDKVDMDILDLSRILGIFLDNAIEAALEAAVPILHLAAITDTTETVFIISNSFVDHQLDLNTLSDPNISTKGNQRGIGLYNVAQIIHQYNHVYLDTEIKGGLFIQTLHIYCA